MKKGIQFHHQGYLIIDSCTSINLQMNIYFTFIASDLVTYTVRDESDWNSLFTRFRNKSRSSFPLFSVRMEPQAVHFQSSNIVDKWTWYESYCYQKCLELYFFLISPLTRQRTQKTGRSQITPKTESLYKHTTLSPTASRKPWI